MANHIEITIDNTYNSTNYSTYVEFYEKYNEFEDELRELISSNNRFSLSNSSNSSKSIEDDITFHGIENGICCHTNNSLLNECLTNLKNNEWLIGLQEKYNMKLIINEPWSG